MSILSGYGKYKRYILTSEGYKLCSQWTSSNTVEMGDGNTAETNLGSIKGITDSLTATSSNIALSASAGNNLQTQVDTLNSNLSHIGMIIHTTTLDTEEKVKAIYGGTTWVKIEGRFLLGQSGSYVINSTGGEASHTLTVNEIPSHNHLSVSSGRSQVFGFTPGGWSAVTPDTTNTNATNDKTGYTGGGKAHNNMPPYKVVYIWERTA